jgi:hypothetical protein
MVNIPNQRGVNVKLRSFWVVLSLGSLLAACTYEHREGNDRISPNAISSIRKGITAKEQVRSVLGDPQSIKTQRPIPQPPGAAPLQAKWTASEIWAFWKSSDRKPLVSLPFISARHEHSSFMVIIYFDERGVVLDSEIEDIHS